MTLRKIIPSGGMGDGRRRRLFGVVNGVSLAFVVVNIFYFLQLVISSDVVVEDIIESMKVTAGVTFGDKESLKTVLSNKNWHEGKSLLWLNWATKLDETDVYYFLPDMYDTLKELTGEAPNYVKVKAEDRVLLYIVGTYQGDQPFGPFWEDRLDDKLDGMMKKYPHLSTKRRLKFVKALYEEMSKDEKYESVWKETFLSSSLYLMHHRQIVKANGEYLGVEMRDHDLTKSRIVQLALGAAWHWRGAVDRTEEEKAIDVNASKEGHLEKEDHHPEHCKVFFDLAERLRKTNEEINEIGKNLECEDETEKDKLDELKIQLQQKIEQKNEIEKEGKVFVSGDESKLNPMRVFVDRLSVHIQKEGRDSAGGWGIKNHFAPAFWMDTNIWENTKRELFNAAKAKAKGEVNLYTAVYEPVLTDDLLDKFLTPIAEFLWRNGYKPLTGKGLTGKDVSKGHLLRGFDKSDLLRAFNNHSVNTLSKLKLTLESTEGLTLELTEGFVTHEGKRVEVSMVSTTISHAELAASSASRVMKNFASNSIECMAIKTDSIVIVRVGGVSTRYFSKESAVEMKAEINKKGKSLRRRGRSGKRSKRMHRSRSRSKTTATKKHRKL